MPAKSAQPAENKQENSGYLENHENERENHELLENGGEGPVSSSAALDAALQHWTTILNNPEASDTAKMNAANGLARFGRDELGSHGGKIEQMGRQELRQEIAKTREKLGLV